MYLEISVADLCRYNLLSIVIVLKNSENYFVSMKTYILYIILILPQFVYSNVH